MSSMDGATTSRIQVETELDYDYLGKREIVRVKYRPEGVRRWTRLVVIPDEGQSVADLLREGHLIAQAHMRQLAGAPSAASCVPGEPK